MSRDHDPLAEVLALLRPEAVLAAELRAHGRWSLALDRYPALKFGAIVEGECVIGLRGRSMTTLQAGDVFLLCGAQPYVIGTDLRAPSRKASELFRNTTKEIAQIGSPRSKPTVRALGGHFVLDPVNAHLLIDALPAIVRIPATDAGPLRTLMPLLVDEVGSGAPGRPRALAQLAQLVLVYALRHIDSSGQLAARSGWLRALSDPRVGAALRHIHSTVAQGTSLLALARVAGMSRTAFASRFKELVGQPPLAYVIQWRMSLAKDALRTSDRAIGELAYEVGYESESAFSMAFRREVGCSPRDYRRSGMKDSPPMG